MHFIGKFLRHSVHKYKLQNIASHPHYLKPSINVCAIGNTGTHLFSKLSWFYSGSYLYTLPCILFISLVQRILFKVFTFFCLYLIFCFISFHLVMGQRHEVFCFSLCRQSILFYYSSPFFCCGVASFISIKRIAFTYDYNL